MPRNEVIGLQSVCNSFISLHRSEGLGLGLAECMVQGKAVIGTAYSGNLEFMNKENSCLVDYRMVPILPGEYAYDQTDVSWAEPDIDQAASYMRRLVEDEGFYAQIAAAGQEEIKRRWNYQTTAGAIRKRLLELGLLA
jgi:glycosyltransferase involved in cell wall biosynthesis